MKTEPYRVIIVEDEPEQQQEVTRLLKESGNLEIIGTAADVGAAVKLLSQHQPDLVILDVQLPPGDCFDILAALGEFRFKIIFTTSHDTYAIRAFRLSAIDYLLKPLDPAEFFDAIARFKNRMDDESQAARIGSMLANMRVVEAGYERVALPTLTGFIYIPVREIVRCESDNTYTSVFTVDRRKLVISRTLKDCEQQLQGFDFFRVHNSHLVNLRHVVEYQKGEGGMVRMKDGSTVEVSRRRKDEFLRRFNVL